MYRCSICKKKFEEPKKINTTYESYYGVASDFQSYTPLTLEVCPFCSCEEINEIEEYDEEEEE